MLTGKRPPSALLTLFVAFLALCAAPGSAWAHALLVDSQFRNGAVLQSAPREIVLRFDARIEASLSSVKLLRSDGRSFPVSIAAAGGEKEPDRLAVTLPGLAREAFLSCASPAGAFC